MNSKVIKGANRMILLYKCFPYMGEDQETYMDFSFIYNPFTGEIINITKEEAGDFTRGNFGIGEAKIKITRGEIFLEKLTLDASFKNHGEGVLKLLEESLNTS
jgi:hypothetical protein